MGAPLQKEAKAGRNLNSGRVPTQQELVYGECPPTKGSKGEKDLGFRVSALGFKGIDWRPLQGQARGKPLQQALGGSEGRKRDRETEGRRDRGGNCRDDGALLESSARARGRETEGQRDRDTERQRHKDTAKPPQ